VIANGRETDILLRLRAGEALGTFLEADCEPVAARKQWIASQLSTQGELILDAGAAKVLRESGSSLLAVGIVAVSGQFNRGDVVLCRDPDGVEVARGLVNYAAGEVDSLKGLASDNILEVLGYDGDDEIVHRDNLILAE
jgi:glutamate 5-kinase